MWHLIHKDFILNFKIMLLNLLILLCFAAFLRLEQASPRAIFSSLGLITAMTAFSSLGREDKFKGFLLTCSLPVRRVHILQAIFASSYISALGSLIAAIATVALLPFGQLSGFQPFNLHLWIAALLILGGILALLLPFVIRFGISGLMFFLIMTQGVGITTLALASFHIRFFSNFIQSLTHAIKHIIFVSRPVSQVTLIFVLQALSFAMSYALFRRKDI